MKSKNIGTIVIAIAIVITALISSNAYMNRNKSNDTIIVTGLGSKDFVSDLIVWRSSFSKKSMVLKDASLMLDQDRENIRKYLVSKGISEKNIIFEAVNINKEFEYTYNKEGLVSQTTFSGYLLSQNLRVESNEVDKVESISREISELINQGIEFYSNNPEYYYTKLTKLKLEMIEEATKDANARAQIIAKNAGSEVGRLKSASLGVFQIIAQNSSEDYSWGGSFNTDSKRKSANITVKLVYQTN
ncbi:MAG: SIMPL domain-containing protein [Bacteroidia bacterium]|nr:SIMPL domain-containing protein [Bacteroidia bacterium]MCZ2248468.1 SIMPL domain-containing protein [Bacteroidia bacterium]